MEKKTDNGDCPTQLNRNNDGWWNERQLGNGWRVLRVKGGDTAAPPEEWFKRPPRRRAYMPAYIGHAAQGFGVGLLCGLIPPLLGWLLARYFLEYQTQENSIYRHWRDAWYAGEAPTPDCGSRDIADFMVGLWAATPFSLAWGAFLLWLTYSLLA